jgi:hypothetical protein
MGAAEQSTIFDSVSVLICPRPEFFLIDTRRVPNSISYFARVFNKSTNDSSSLSKSHLPVPCSAVSMTYNLNCLILFVSPTMMNSRRQADC